jgi:membrane protease YdiL (CAAX protease family)
LSSSEAINSQKPPLWPVAIAFVVAVFVVLVLNVLLLMVFPRAMTEQGLSLQGICASAAVTSVALLTVAVAFAWASRGNTLQALGFERGVKMPLSATLIAAGTLTALSLSFAVTSELLGHADSGALGAIQRSLLGAPSMAFGLSLLCLAALPALAEELFFRGYVQARLRRRLGLVGAIGLSSALFGLFHMDLRQGLYAAAAGLLLGFLRERFGHLGVPMLAHGTNNLVGLVLTRFAVAPEARSAKVAMAVGLSVAGALGIWALLRLPRPRPQ